MRIKLFIYIVLFFGTSSCAKSSLDTFFIKRAKENNVEAEVIDLIKKHNLNKNNTLESRKSFAKIQLSFEQAVNDCIISQNCQEVKIIIQTPLPASPLRIKDNPNEVSGSKDETLNQILLKRKDALLSLSSKSVVKILLAYKENGINYNEYAKLLHKYINLLDCKGCYGFFDDKISQSGAMYNVKMKTGENLLFTIHNNQFREKSTLDKKLVLYYK